MQLRGILSYSLIILISELLMEGGEMQKYQEISKLYKEIIDAITTLEVPQLKLYLVNLDKRIANKETPILADFNTLVYLLNNLKEAKGKLPIHFAVARGNLEIVRHLIETGGVEHATKDKEGNSPFLTAVEHGHLDLVRYFIEELNYSSNEVKEGGSSPLHLAANHNHVDLINYLIAKGSDIERVSIYGKPLNWAVGSRQYEATKVLLDHGADPNGDSTGSSLAPLILAVDFKDRQLYDLLLSKGANPNVKDPSGYSVLHVAAEKGDLQFVRDLVQRGADVGLEVEGKTPLYLAFENKKMDVVGFLKQHTTNFEKIQQQVREKEQQKEQQAQQENKELAEEIKNIGNKFYAEKKYEEALKEYLKALQYDRSNEVIHRNLAACYLALKQFDAALVHCGQAKQKDPRNVKTLYREAQAHIGLGNLVEAASSMWECSMAEPNNNGFRLEFQRLFEEAKHKHHGGEAK